MLNVIEKILNFFVSDGEKSTDVVPKRDIDSSLKKSLEIFRNDFNESEDLIIREMKICGINSAIISIDGLINKSITGDILRLITKFESKTNNPLEIYKKIRDEVIAFSDQIEVGTYEEAMQMAMVGCAVFALDGCNKMIVLGVQGFSIRGISEPTSEKSQRGSREGFIEALRINITMVRRRVTNPTLKFETMEVGSTTRTTVCLCYLADRIEKKILKEVRKRIKNCDLKSVMTSGCVSPYLEEDGDLSLFASVGMSERPDTVCGKLSEGRIAVIVDGSPTVLIVPYLFVEYFHNIDDYALRPYFASLNRILKFVAFFIATLLPGLYVGLATFNPELFPGVLLNKIAMAVGTTPFSLMLETLIIHFLYEIMREAGLRLPQNLGHAVSIVGGLVIGDAAVNSGLIGAPTLMVVALTSISSYIIPNLYEPITLLRIFFVIAGGTLGIWGIMILFTAMLINLCSKSNFGIPFTSPVSPFGLLGMRDTFVRSSWKILSKRRNRIQSMPGSEI
ncbi:MAG: spore germination protein [Oscillospiraceae bacterium]|nr:spore germination protein [Oscillospiraceae bacterium]